MSDIESLAARVTLCAFHQDEQITKTVLDDCITSRGKAAAVIAMLAQHLAVMLTDAVGEDNARTALESVILEEPK